MKSEHPIFPSPTVQEAEAVDELSAAQVTKNEAVIRLLKEWMADESGYDEQIWPIIREIIEENRLSYRARFND